MATSTVKVLSPRIVAQTGKKCTATAILLHGSGGTGDDIRGTFRLLLQEELAFPHIRFVYPTAPARPYTLAGGQQWHVWFDRPSLGLDEDEHQGSVDAMARQLGHLIDAEVRAGVPLHRIVLATIREKNLPIVNKITNLKMRPVVRGGFSMGGSMALHLGYRFYPKVAGVLVMSSFLYSNSSVYKALEKRGSNDPIPPLQCYHGEDDELVLYDWGKHTHSKLTSLGVKGNFISLPNLTHSINRTMAMSARDWIAKVLPEEHNL